MLGMGDGFPSNPDERYRGKMGRIAPGKCMLPEMANCCRHFSAVESRQVSEKRGIEEGGGDDEMEEN